MSLLPFKSCVSTQGTVPTPLPQAQLEMNHQREAVESVLSHTFSGFSTTTTPPFLTHLLSPTLFPSIAQLSLIFSDPPSSDVRLANE